MKPDPKRWSERQDFVEVYSHQAILDFFRDRLERDGWDVYPKRRTEDGRGCIMIGKDGGYTAFPYHLPEDLERVERTVRQIATSEGQYVGPSRLEL
jgi:hypothetical protein